MRRRLVPPIATFFLALAVLIPPALALPQHGDEKIYVWKAAYYSQRLARLDFGPGDGSYLDPGWSSTHWWAIEQPFGAHWLYAVAMAIAGAPPAARPFSYHDPGLQGPDTEIPPRTLQVTRLTAVTLAAFGFALVVLRLGWPGLAVPVILLSTRFVRTDLARAWAEGPLLFGFGLAILTFGTRWFAVVAGAAAAIKLTGLVLWPAALLHPSFSASRIGHLNGIVVAWLSFTLLNPLAWFGGDPLFLFTLVVHRVETYVAQCALYGSDLGPQLGVFLPTRYIWPVEFGLAVALVLLSQRSSVVRSLWRSWRIAFGASSTSSPGDGAKGPPDSPAAGVSGG